MKSDFRSLLALFLLAIYCPAQQSGSIAGMVKSTAGNPLPGARVHLAKVGKDTGTRVVSTGPDGAYRVNGLDSGRYRLSVTMADFRPSGSRLIAVVPETIVMDFNLEPIALNSFAEGGFVGNDPSEGSLPSFRASGIEGSTAPGGYSAGASAEQATIAVRASAAGTIEECAQSPIPHVSSARLARRLYLAGGCNRLRQAASPLANARTAPGSR